MTRKGVWNLQQVRDKQLQSLWSYQEPATLWSWGTNNYGQVGVNTNDEISSPTQIGSLTTWMYASGATGGGGGNYAINDSNELFAWGNNPSGQLGQNNGTRYSSPVQIPGTTWKYISNSYGESTAATKTDGTLWSWGANGSGVLGHNEEATHYSSPVQIPGTTWKDIGANSLYQSSATKTDGTLWTWGSSSYGGLAQNNQTSYSSPVQVGSATDWDTGADKISVNKHAAIAIKTDGTMWAWGSNQYGNLGQNNPSSPAQRSSPIQIPGTTWNTIASGSQHFLATRTDGTLWVWGINSQGRLGLNTDATTYSPTQVPGTDWSILAGGERSSLAIQIK